MARTKVRFALRHYGGILFIPARCSKPPARLPEVR